MTRSAGTEAALDLLRVLASTPRSVGTDGERRARATCTEYLRAAGFEIRERPFDYSQFTGRWATPLAGLIAFLVLSSTAIVAHHHDRVRSSLALLVVTSVMLALLGRWLARNGVLDFPLMRARAVNLEARRRSPRGDVLEPRVWLVAHLDSKSQPVPMALRVAGISLTALSGVGLVVLALLALLGVEITSWWIPVGAVGALSSIPIMASTVGNKSPGALDNASGVASVLLAAERGSAEQPIGVLLTSAEELGLAGARAWVREGSDRVPMLNCDGVDDEGELVLMYAGRRPERLIDAARRSAASGAPRARVRRLPSGILVDSVAFADAGRETITVSRGSWRTLARIHRPSDDLAHLRGTGVDETATLLSALATELLNDQRT